jgi:hypothetical protein
MGKVLTFSMAAWDVGSQIYGDEQTIGFKGNHAAKQRIDYKKEGDGFSADAIAEDWYTYTFFSLQCTIGLVNLNITIIYYVNVENGTLNALNKSCTCSDQNDWKRPHWKKNPAKSSGVSTQPRKKPAADSS